MRKYIALAVAAVAVLFAATSCEEEEMATHYITVEGSSNYTTNLYLQAKVSSLIKYDSDHTDHSFFGTVTEAEDWFNETADYLESAEFAEAEPQVPVLEGTTATLILMSYGSESSDGFINYGHEVTRRTIEFQEYSLP